MSTAPVVVEAHVHGAATLLAFTVGGMERRGEDLDTGLERLRVDGRDDTTIPRLRWRS